MLMLKIKTKVTFKQEFINETNKPVTTINKGEKGKITWISEIEEDELYGPFMAIAMEDKKIVIFFLEDALDFGSISDYVESLIEVNNS